MEPRNINFCYFKKIGSTEPIVVNIDEIEAFEDGAIFMKSGRTLEVAFTYKEIQESIINTYNRINTQTYGR